MFSIFGRRLTYAIPNASPSTFTRAVTTPVNHINGTGSSALTRAKPFDEIPGFKSFPFIGTAWIYFPIIGKYSILKQHKADMDKYEKFGSIVRERIGNYNLVNCYDPEDIETVLRNEGKYPHREGLTSLTAYRELRRKWYKSPGLLILQGHDWRDLRSKTQPYIMKPKLIHAFLGPMQDIAQDLVSRILFIRDRNNEVKDFLPELYKWALESVGCVCLDTRLGCLSNNLDSNSEAIKMINAVHIMFYTMNKLEPSTGNVLWWKFLPSPTWNKLVKAADYFTEISLKYINRAFEELQKNVREDKELTLLQSMLLTPGLDVSGVMTTSMDLLFAGIDSTSNAEAFFLYLLAKNPEKQEKLHQEIKKILPSSTDRLTVAALNELKYLKACIKESMRLVPIVRGIARRLDHDVVLSGYRVPAGTDILCLQQTANSLEKNYPNANQFVPERWLDKKNKPNPYLFQVFGIGIRSCLGRRVAEQEMMCATVEIIKNFTVEYHGTDIDILTRLVGVPDKPLKLKFIDRV